MTRLLVFVTLLLFPAGAFAQTPLVLEPVRNPVVFAPDYKVTRVNGETGQLAGGYAGRLFDERLFVGGGGYWLVSGSPGDELRYGGLILGWSIPAGSRLRFGMRGLAGMGQATLGTDLAIARFVQERFDARDPRGIRFGSGPNMGRTASSAGVVRVRSREDFFVFEPQAGLFTGLSRHVGLQWSAGYRLTSADRLGDQVDGATGSVALELAW